MRSKQSARDAALSLHYWRAVLSHALELQTVSDCGPWVAYCRLQVASWRRVVADTLALDWRRTVAVVADRAPLACGEVA